MHLSVDDPARHGLTDYVQLLMNFTHDPLSLRDQERKTRVFPRTH